MQRRHLMTYLQSQVWAVEPGFLARAQAVFETVGAGARMSGADLHAALDLPTDEERADRSAPPRIAVVPVLGVIESHSSSLGTSAREVQALLREAMADDRVDGILFDVDSPGGAVTGVPELADEIRGSSKPMVAFNAGVMASAAYWLGAAAGTIVSTPSGLTGSIGVFTWHQDVTAKLEQDGIVVTEISAGEFKTETAPWKPLSPEALEHQQSQVDHFYRLFTKSTATDRKTTQTAVREGYGQGRVLTADKAVNANLVDDVGTFDVAVAQLVAKIEKRRGRERKAANRARQIARAERAART
jgi:capsid assembly protease